MRAYDEKVLKPRSQYEQFRTVATRIKVGLLVTSLVMTWLQCPQNHTVVLDTGAFNEIDNLPFHV